ncbi:MAG: flagellar protein FlaG [Peptostreptococcales bacterium]
MNVLLPGNQIQSNPLVSNRHNPTNSSALASSDLDNIEPIQKISKLELATFDMDYLKSDEGQEQMHEMLEVANKIIFGNGTHFKFQIHEKTGATMVKMIDTETNEIIKEFPSEKVLNIIAGLCELAGILFDEKA